MSDFDREIKQALLAESDEVWKEADEQGLFEQALGVMKGRQKRIAVIGYVVSVVIFALAIYCAVRFFGAETTQHQIAWAVGFLFANGGVAMMKAWFWMQMDKNTVIREVKRLELQIATLAGIIKHRE